MRINSYVRDAYRRAVESLQASRITISHSKLPIPSCALSLRQDQECSSTRSSSFVSFVLLGETLFKLNSSLAEWCCTGLGSGSFRLRGRARAELLRNSGVVLTTSSPSRTRCIAVLNRSTECCSADVFRRPSRSRALGGGYQPLKQAVPPTSDKQQARSVLI